MHAQGPLEEIDMGNGVVKRPTYISAKVEPSIKEKMVELLRELKDCFSRIESKHNGYKAINSTW